MGIHGLTSFIDDNPHLLKDHELHDCRVVIDGNNFYHFLYFYHNVRFQFGGDFDIFQRKIFTIFSMFKSCNVQAFVVFDGAYTADGKKLKTTLSRATDRVYAAQRIINGQRGVLIPCLAQHAFKQALDKLGIPHVTCDFEADSQLVTLANQWNCPVISNDSDFYIFDLSGGFIPLDYIDFRPREIQKEPQDGKVGCFLPVQYYHVDEFIKCFKSLNRSLLPLFATMLGNDYVNASAFEAFYQKIPKTASGRYTAPKKHQKIVSVLYWLEAKQHKEELVSEVLSFIRPEQRQRVEKLLSNSISGYMDTQDFESFDLKAFLEGDQSAAKHNTDGVITVTGQHLPAWFVTACRCGEIPVFLLNAALLHCVMLPIQVESKSHPASFVTSRVIREVIYGLLLGAEDSHLPPELHLQDFPQKPSEPTAAKTEHECDDENSDCDVLLEAGTDKSPQNGSDKEYSERSTDILDVPGLENSGSSANTSATKQTENGVVEYTRHTMELRRIMVSARATLSGVGSLPSLENLPAVGLRERQAILTEALGVTAEFASQFDPCLQLYMMCLVTWAKNASPSVSLHLLKGFILSVVLLHVHQEIADRANSINEDCIAEKVGDSTATDTDQSVGGMKTRSSSGTVQDSGLPHDHPEQQQPVKCKITQKTQSKEGLTFSVTGACCSEKEKVLTKVRDNLKKYYHDPSKISSKNPSVHEIFHGSAQFLACLLDTIHLNSLLCHPFPSLQPADLFNGSFIYTIVHELKARSNPVLFLSEMLVKGSKLMVLFDSLCSAVVCETGENVFAEQKVQGTKCCKSAQKRKKNRTVESEQQTAVDRVWTDEGQAEQEDVTFYDLNNRFGVLLIDDGS